MNVTRHVNDTTDSGGHAPRFVIRSVALFERPVQLRMPFRFGVVTLTACPQAFVQVQIELLDGRCATGAAAEMMAPKWFDKNLSLSNDDNFNQLRDVCRMARDAYLSDSTPDTAFGHFARHYEAHQRASIAGGYNALLANYGPALIDRAILDASCRAEAISFYTALQSNRVGIGAAHRQFDGLNVGLNFGANAGLNFDRFLASLRPAAAIEARHTIGLVDAIANADQSGSVNDGLPETLEAVVARYGHRYFKLKVSGQLEHDLDRLTSIAAVLDARAQAYFVSLDGNEQYESAEQVLELIAHMRAVPALSRLVESILFVEQPISRGVALSADFRNDRLGLPVIIDESDGTLDTFAEARARGYAGVSSKTCKGLYKSVLNAARCRTWNAEAVASGSGQRYFMSAEDLTTQAGLAVQQDLALVNLLGITHVERNGHHYVNGMAAQSASEQSAFLAAHPDVYEQSHGAVRLAIRDGRIALNSLECIGYASAAMPDFRAMQAMPLAI